jgi:uncharacterized protein YhhL (DUF1145 family)
MKKTIWIPIVGGFIFGVLSFLISAANITIEISEDLILGPYEILDTLSAALFGPIGLLITQLGMDSGAYWYFIKDVYPGPQGIYFIIGDYIAHSVSMVAVMFFYRFIYERIKLPRLLVGWFLVMGIYYIMLVLLQVTLFNIVVPGGATYLNYFSNVRLEFILVTFTTSLVLLALPERYRKPQWYEPKKAPRQNG